MIPITKAVFDETDFALIQEPLKSGWVVQGPYVRKFEEEFEKMTAGRHAIATTSCTTAMHIAVAALGLGPGDEVIVPSFTWIATPNCVEYQGAKPVFVDIDLETFNVDVSKIEPLINERTRGIIPVHLFGLSADMDPIVELARKYNLWIMEDAACGFDTWYRGRHVGTIGDIGAFSFHPRKAITTGEGGMILTNSDHYNTLSRALRDHGASKTDLQRHEETKAFLLPEYHVLGYNYRMTDIQGALGVTQMAKSAKIMDGRRAASARYDEQLADIDWLRLPFRHPDYVSGVQSYVCLFAPEEPTLENVDRLTTWRNEIMVALENQGISTRQGTHAPPHLPYYAKKYGISPSDFPMAYLAERLSITLPVYSDMTEAETSEVVSALRTAFAPAEVR